MDWSIQQIARLTGTTSRTLRHYDDIGLLPARRTASNGYRHYDQRALVRLQRILLLRELGLGLEEIGAVLDRERSESDALTAHLEWLRAERDSLERRIASVARTLTALEEGEELMAEDMFDGFDHTQHRAEVEQRWGTDAYARSDAWWRGMDAPTQAAWKRDAAALAADWTAAAERGEDPAGPTAQALADRHARWLQGIGGTPASVPGGDLAGYLRSLGEMYVADPRFAANYGGERGARFVSAALHVYAAAI